MSNKSTDIYDLSSLVSDIQKKYIPIEDDTLFMGIYGYLNDIHSNILQNAAVTAAETGNEAFPIRAKFEKNLLTYAMTYNIKDINAIPAKMDIMLGFIEKELITHLDKYGVFRMDKNCNIFISSDNTKIEYHLDYDLLIIRTSLPDGTYVYSARYDIDRQNIISDINNPYLAPPIFLTFDNDKFILVNCTIRQVQQSTIYKKIISNNILENKTIDFEFDNQLAAFEIMVTENGVDRYLTPIFEGLPLNGEDLYCYYSYIDANSIRIKFDRSSYEPKFNCTITITLKTTIGSQGNFIYKDNINFTLSSDTIDYKGLNAKIVPLTDSFDGLDKKSVENLKEITPKQILARGTIINNKDLENYFNSLDNSKLYFFKRRDNQIERLYYAYMIIKDENNNIIPSNTINLSIKKSEFSADFNEGRFAFSLDKIIEYNDNEVCTIFPNTNSLDLQELMDLENEEFLYTMPFTCVVNKDPLSVSYYMNNINDDYYLKFSYINQNSELQYISTTMHIQRITLEDDDYIITMELQQNVNVEKNIVTLDENKNITTSKLKPMLYINNTQEQYYIEGDVISYDKSIFKYTIEFRLHTNSIIDINNRIRINDLFLKGQSASTYAYLHETVPMSIYLFTELDQEYGRDDADTIFPNMTGYTLCNKYDTNMDVNLFYNYSNIIQSPVTVSQEDNEDVFLIKKIPVVRYSYINNIERYKYLLQYLQYKKIYIDQSLEVIENSFGIDLKFFNTYGKSKLFTIGHEGELLDKVNLALVFKIDLKPGADEYAKDYIIAEIKQYIENINNNISEIHMTNLTTDLTNKFYSDVNYIEFQGINKYNALYQYIRKLDYDDNVNIVPEFLNINLKDNETSDIEIILV